MITQIRFLVPNLFTALNFLGGVFAILLAAGIIDSPLDSKITLVFACHLIIYCVLLDKLDGFAAKVLKASSEFGAQFDSFADLVAFGLAPAICLIFAYQQWAPEFYERNQILLLACLSFSVLCATIRLAKYNAIDSEAYPDWFSGMPSTLAGGINAVALIIAYNHNFFTSSDSWLPLLVVVQVVTSILMVSPLYLPKFKMRKTKWLNGVQFFGIITGYTFGFAMIYSEYLLFIISFYAVVGFGYGLFKHPKHEESDHDLTAQTH